MQRMWLAAQVALAAGLLMWVSSAGSGCGAKSGLLLEDDESELPEPVESEPEPTVILVECDSQADCNDGVYCNGLESCVDGYCRDGEIVECPGGDACNMAYCDEERERCVEIFIARDADGDSHFQAPCGDDCDDDNPAVHPGAVELCNGIDDDCDDVVDEDLMEDCEDFGHRVCVGGSWSDCVDCTLCIPGSVRYCDTPTYCSWGEQRCNELGNSWGECYETSPPSGCEGYIFDQDCCVRSGSCCQDWMDWDNDGDYNDFAGSCDDVMCPGID